MRYSMAVTPKNYLLFACHFINFGSQLTQGYRFYDYWHMGGQKRWETIREQAKQQASKVEAKAESIADQAKDAVKGS